MMVMLCAICGHAERVTLQELTTRNMYHYITAHWSILVVLRECYEDPSKIKSTEILLRGLTGK